MKIGRLEVNDQKNPIGIELQDLTFSWEVTEAAGTRQQSARLEIARDPAFADIVYDSTETSLDSFACTPELAGQVQPGRPYFWRVSVTDETGDRAMSETATFEGGRGGSFTGKWIAPRFTREIRPVLRKTFVVEQLEQIEQMSSSRLYICGLGLYEAYLNGRRIGEQYLTPYFTDYRYRVQYQTYDIGGLLKEGVNTLDVWLGDGWYKGRFGYLGGGQLREYYGDEFKLIADLVLGDRVIATDESWQCLRSPVLADGIYDGETYDARREQVLAAPTVRDISGVRFAEPPAAELVPMIGLPVVRREVLEVKQIITTPRGETVLDFGQEITGWVEFSVSVKKDTHVRLQYGEVLQDGCFYNENLRTARAEYTWISDGSRKLARPHFTFYGFRYVKVTGVEVDVKNFHAFRAVALYSNLQEIGEIRTPDDKVNRLVLNTIWGLKGNFLDIPTDCPQRDERLGWTGDAGIFCGAASFHVRTGTFYRKYLRDMADEQREKDGAVPFVVPDVLSVGREKMMEPPYSFEEDQWGEAGAAVWGDAATIIPWKLYLHTGNRARLREQYDNMRQWTDFILSMDEKYCGGKRLWTRGFQFGDWLSLDAEGDKNDMDNKEGGTDKHFIASCFYMYAARLTARAAAVLDRTEDAARYGKLAGEVREAVREKYRTAPGRLCIDTQTAYALAIRLEVFDAEERGVAGEYLAGLLHQRKDHLATGFVGTAYLMDALTETGQAALAYTLLFNEDYPSWLYEVNMGATTVWERWNSILPDGRISDTGMNSLNHYAYGVIAEWIYSAVCGLNLDEEHPAGQRVVFAPHPDARLGEAEARVRLAAGEYCVGWRLDGDRIIYRFTVPFNGALRFVPDRELADLTLRRGGVPAGMPDGDFTAGTWELEAGFRSTEGIE